MYCWLRLLGGLVDEYMELSLFLSTSLKILKRTGRNDVVLRRDGTFAGVDANKKVWGRLYRIHFQLRERSCKNQKGIKKGIEGCSSQSTRFA
jgi:hypothetical protein